MTRRIALTLASLVIALAAAAGTAQLALPGVVERRLDRFVAEHEEVRGGVEEVRVCVPCGSYTLVHPDLSVRTEGEWQPAFSAQTVVVSLLPASLLSLAPTGSIHGDSPSFVFRAGSQGDLDLQGIVEALLPVPADRVTLSRGRLELVNAKVDPPIRLRFHDVEVRATNLTRRGGAPLEIDLEGRVGDEGVVRASLVIPNDRTGFLLEPTLRQVPLRELNGVLRHSIGMDVTAGTLDAEGEIRADAESRLEGRVSCRVAGLDLLELADLVDDDPLSVVWEGMAAGAIAIASDEEGLSFELEIEESAAGPQVDAWSLLATFVERSVWGLIESPERALRWLAGRVVPSDG